MSMWIREEVMLQELPPERQANVEIVSSAYASVFAEKAYLTMPVTTGKRFYDVLDRYGVHTVEELERKRPGALREEIILPNIEDGKNLATKLKQDNVLQALVVPGIFEARKQRWSQEEYMVLWLRFISSSARELYLSDGWEYSNGGAIEFVQAKAKQNHLMGNDMFRYPIERTIDIYEHTGEEIEIVRGSARLAEAIGDLTRRNHDTTILRRELGILAGMAWYMVDFAKNTYHMDKVWKSAESVGVRPNIKMFC